MQISLHCYGPNRSSRLSFGQPPELREGTGPCQSHEEETVQLGNKALLLWCVGPSSRKLEFMPQSTFTLGEKWISYNTTPY